MAEKKPRGRGRPPLLTTELTEQIAAQVRLGLPIELAAEASGISRQTVLEWVRRGEGREDEDRPANAKNGLYVEFANRYRRARAEFAKALLQPCLETIAGKRPSKKKRGPDGKPVMVKSLGAPKRAFEAHWHLARRFPEFWGAGREMVLETEDDARDGDGEGGGFTINVNLTKPEGA